MPVPSDERYNWMRVRMDAVEVEELRELAVDAWRMCVPKRVALEHLRHESACQSSALPEETVGGRG